ncbi:MAG TPA: hypothetical protein VGR35_04995 [Tepidisphaeraceae bacterium]|nr:hypothetical protein [Tepidisphaeraceae bacterium]
MLVLQPDALYALCRVGRQHSVQDALAPYQVVELAIRLPSPLDDVEALQFLDQGQ